MQQSSGSDYVWVISINTQKSHSHIVQSGSKNCWFTWNVPIRSWSIGGTCTTYNHLLVHINDLYCTLQSHPINIPSWQASFVFRLLAALHERSGRVQYQMSHEKWDTMKVPTRRLAIWTETHANLLSFSGLPMQSTMHVILDIRLY